VTGAAPAFAGLARALLRRRALKVGAVPALFGFPAAAVGGRFWFDVVIFVPLTRRLIVRYGGRLMAA